MHFKLLYEFLKIVFEFQIKMFSLIMGFRSPVNFEGKILAGEGERDGWILGGVDFSGFLGKLIFRAVFWHDYFCLFLPNKCITCQLKKRKKKRPPPLLATVGSEVFIDDNNF